MVPFDKTGIPQLWYIQQIVLHTTKVIVVGPYIKDVGYFEGGGV